MDAGGFWAFGRLPGGFPAPVDAGEEEVVARRAVGENVRYCVRLALERVLLLRRSVPSCGEGEGEGEVAKDGESMATGAVRRVVGGGVWFGCRAEIKPGGAGRDGMFCLWCQTNA